MSKKIVFAKLGLLTLASFAWQYDWMKLKSIRGMNDIYEDEARLWAFIEEKVKHVFHSHGYTEIRTPILENSNLFKRSVGDTSDIVEKEMYTFSDRNGDSLSLRPEGTASVVRAYIEHSLMQNMPIQKFYYIGPMFRHERPQKGRYRQFYQFGIELLGLAEPLADVEVLSIQQAIIDSLEIGDVALNISSLGCKVCRPTYQEELKAELNVVADQLCADCQRRKDKNPLRVFDCKVPTCNELTKDMAKMMDHLCDECSAHFAVVEKGLSALEIPYSINKSLVRGLDYYNRTAFEFVYNGDALGSQATISAGGRYDSLVELLGGSDTPAVGFAAGIERFALILEEKKQSLNAPVDLYCVIADAEGMPASLKIASELRKTGLRVELDLQMKKMKHQMKRANKLAAKYVLIIGSEEIKNDKAILKDMNKGEQQEIALKDLKQNLLHTLVN